MEGTRPCRLLARLGGEPFMLGVVPVGAKACLLTASDEAARDRGDPVDRRPH